MVYQMHLYVDGGCRGNGCSDAIGAASAIQVLRWGQKYYCKTRRLLPGHDDVSNQRAEITAIILGLEMALDAYDDLDTYPKLDVTIHSDSRYAVGCMDDWIYKWANNGWTNAKGREVANRDFIEEASDLDDNVKRLGRVRYDWIPRDENVLADKHCREELDDMEREGW